MASASWSAWRRADHDALAVGERLLAQLGVARQLVEVLKIAARRERAAVPGQHDRARFFVGIDLREQRSQRVMQFVVRRVEIVGPVQPHDADRPVGFDVDHLRQVVVHAGKSKSRRAMRLR